MENALPAMHIPSIGSTLAFLTIVLGLALLFIMGIDRVFRGEKMHDRFLIVGAASMIIWLALHFFLSSSGFVSSLAFSLKFGLYFAFCNGTAVALCFSPLGTRFVQHLPISLLVGVQAFRLPLELVLHEWYLAGTLPVQMTYSGENFDIISGFLGVFGLFVLPRLEGARRHLVVFLLSGVGFMLLLRVMHIVTLSAPWPLRSYMNDPPVLLVFHTPYVWVLPICVSGALFLHLLSFRWLWQHRSARSS